MRKLALLTYFLHRQGTVSLKGKKVIVFVRTKERGERVSEFLRQHKFRACYLHSESLPAKRKAYLEEFRNGHIQILVATDILSRGIDLPEIDAVVNLDLPTLPEDYIHRIGRTGRAGQKGLALTFVSTHTQVLTIGTQEVLRNEEEMIGKIEALLGGKLQVRPKVPGPWVDQRGVTGSTSRGHYDDAGVWIERDPVGEPEEYKGWISNEKLSEEKKAKAKAKATAAVEQPKQRMGKGELAPLPYDQVMKRATQLRFESEKVDLGKLDPKFRLTTARNEVFRVQKTPKEATK